MTDRELLQAWGLDGSEPAFTELVNRYVSLVYAAARRQAGDPQMAEDVTQAVFLVLAQKAASLRSNVVLAGWLFRTTRFVAARALRAEMRRRHREQEAAAMNPETHLPDSHEATWMQVAPFLDEALAALPETDRNAVLLRFFQTKPMRAVGEHLGVSEDAAKKRINRALDKLRTFFSRRGMTITSAALLTIMAREAAQAAPAGLAIRIRTAQTGAAASGTVVALTAAALRRLLLLKLRSALLWGGAGTIAALTLLKFGLGSPQQDLRQAPLHPRVQEISATLTQASPHGSATSAASKSALPGKRFFLNVRTAAANQPIPNTRVLLYAGGPTEVRNEFQTDTNGLCELPIPAKDFDYVYLWVSAEGFVPKVMIWRAYELTDPITSYTTKLDPGLTIHGMVVDEQGGPVAGASIKFVGPGANMMQRENVSFSSELSSVRTDARGQFISRQMPLQAQDGMGLGISHPDFARQWLQVRIPEAIQSNLVVKLAKGFPVSGQVLSERGDPMSGITVSAPEPHGGPNLRAQTGANGEFLLAHLPPGAAELRVDSEGFRPLKETILVGTNTEPVTLKLQASAPTPLDGPKPVRLSGKVVDADSGEPLPRFSVLLDERRGTSRDFIGEGRNGAFDWVNPLTYASEYTLEINAGGYEPQVSTVRQHIAGDQTFEFRLRKGGTLSGRVFQPDGQPAAAAAVGLDGENMGLRFQPPARFVNYGHPVNMTNTDAEGHFSVKSMVGTTGILVVHETGCAVAAASAMTNGSVHLAAWGAIEGTLFVGRSPAANQEVDVGFQSASYTPEIPRISFDFMTNTDHEGHFRFPRVPPGIHTVYRLLRFYSGNTGPIGFSHGEQVTVLPGQTACVTIGGKGRLVTGRYVFSRPVARYNWQAQPVALVEDKPGLVPPKMQMPASSTYFRAWNVYNASIPKYYLEFREDGSFRIEDVPPGRYTLGFRPTAEAADPLADDAWLNAGAVLGAVTNQVLIPVTSGDQAQESLNLGEIQVPIQ